MPFLAGGKRLAVRAVKPALCAFIGAKRRGLTEKADGLGAAFRQEGLREMGQLPIREAVLPLRAVSALSERRESLAVCRMLSEYHAALGRRRRCAISK